MGLLSSSSAKSSSKTSVIDQRVGADNQSVAQRLQGNFATEQARNTAQNKLNNSSILIGSDDVAKTAIEAATQSARDTLQATTDFTQDALTKIFSLGQAQQEQSASAMNTNNELVKLLTAEQATTDTTKFGNLVKIGVAGALAFALIQSGFFNTLAKGFK